MNTDLALAESWRFHVLRSTWASRGYINKFTDQKVMDRITPPVQAQMRFVQVPLGMRCVAGIPR